MASLPGVSDYNNSFVLLLCLLIFPALIIAGVLLLIPVLTLGKAIFFLFKRDFRSAFQYTLIFPIGIVLYFVGQMIADFYAVETFGPTILDKVQLVRNGEAPPQSGGLFVSSGEPKIAFYVNGGFLDITQGIAYDGSDRLAEMFKLRPKDRPKYWQEQAVDVLSCPGNARRIGKQFYLVNISTYLCYQTDR